jgi:hypothetical protein
VTSYVTQYSTAFNTIVNSVASTIQSTVDSTTVVTVSNAATATSVGYVTATTTTSIQAGGSAHKRTAEIEVLKTVSFASAREPVTQEALGLGPPQVIVGSNKKLDVLAEKLARRGLLVERDFTSTLYVTAYSTISSVYTSMISSAQTFYVTSVATNFVTSTRFINAQETVSVTSTIVLTVTVSGSSTIATSEPNTNINPPNTNNNPPNTGLSTGAKAGIGVGSVVGATAIAALVFFILWRRSRKNQDESDPVGVSSIQPELRVDPTTYYDPPKELASVGAAGVAASPHGLNRFSNSGVGIPTVEPVSPTSSNMQNAGQWSPPADYQQQHMAQTASQHYPAHTPPPGYAYNHSPSPPPAAHNPGASIPPGFAGGYPRGVAEMGGPNAVSQGNHGIPVEQQEQAHEMPTNWRYGGT